MAPYDGPLSADLEDFTGEKTFKISEPGPNLRRSIEGELSFLRQAVRRWRRDQANADDLVQDTILQALANAHLWQPGSNLRGWLFTIMRNQFLAGVAKSKRSHEAFAMIAAMEREAAANPTEARLVMRDVERALRRLSSHQRTAIELIGIDGKSYEQAAHLMEMSVPAVRCHLSRGRERLKAVVKGTAPQPARRDAARQAEPPRTFAFEALPELEHV